MAPTFSILIPTRDRASTLGPSIKTCLAQDYAGLEVLVSDNASTPETAQVLAGFSDPRLKCFRQDTRVSMRANFDFLVSRASGDYIIIIGDDDGIMPGAIAEMARYLAQNPTDILNWPGLVYSWKGVLAPDSGLLDAKIRRVFGTLDVIDPATRFSQLLKGQMRSYLDGANLYHGCIRRAVLEKAKGAAGYYFPLHVPDVYACMALLPYASSMAFFHHPLSIPGVSGASHGFSYMADLEADPAKREPTPAERFAAECNADAVVERPYNPHLRATQYHAALSLMHVTRILGREDEVDLDAWADIIIAEARKFCNLVKVMGTLDARFPLDARIIARVHADRAALNVEPAPVVGKSARRQRFGRILIRSAQGGEDTIMNAFAVAEDLFGAPRIARSNPAMRLLRWLRLRSKAASSRYREGRA